MGNQTYGYARVSTEQQNLDRQIDALTGYGVDRLYNEKMTGTRKDRPELRKMLESLTEGDTVVVESLSRLGRSTRDLLELTELFEKKGVHLISLKERIDTSSSTGRLLFNPSLVRSAITSRSNCAMALIRVNNNLPVLELVSILSFREFI